MQLLAGLLFIGILVLLIGAAIYFARGQKPKSQHYGSWSNVLSPQFRGSAMDVGERLNEEIAEGQHQFEPSSVSPSAKAKVGCA